MTESINFHLIEDKELRELVAERHQLFERASSGDVHAIVQASVILGSCSEGDARHFLLEYRDLIDDE